jgi:hypothetical protein
MEKRKAGFSYYKDGVIYYGAGDSYHNGQPVETMVAKVPRAKTQGGAIASSSAVISSPFSTVSIIKDDDRSFII